MSEEENLLTPNAALLDLDDDDDDDLFIKPQKKHKILMLSDHQVAPSGVGVQARFLIEALIKTGKYTFRCLGGAIEHQNYNTIKVNDDFLIKPVQGFGTKPMIRELLLTEQPDAIFLFTDPRQFVWLWEMEDEIHQVCPIVYWHVWDNDPYPAFNSPYYESTDLINCLSHKTYELVKPHFPDRTNYIPHAFPENVYRTLDKNVVKDLNEKNFGDKKDWFKALWVNRNATRKLPADLLVGWQRFLEKLEAQEGHRNALLVMHTDPKDREGPDLLEVAQALDLQNNVLFSAQKLDFENMNILHNITDCVVNISKNEGFGLSTLISMQIGKPTIALATGGETRQVIDYRDGSEHGVALQPVKRLLVGSQGVPYIFEDYHDTEELADAFLKVHNYTDDEKEALSEKMKAYVDHEFNFEDIVRRWDNGLEDCITNWRNVQEQKKAAQEGNWSLVTINPIVNVTEDLPKDSSKPVLSADVVPKKPVNKKPAKKKAAPKKPARKVRKKKAESVK